MTGESFRFLHASNLHLDRVLSGLIEIPEHLLEVFANAPYVAAERVFQAAVREEVDFVVLSGDILDASRGGPRALAFLHEQFSTLEKHQTIVYWAASHSDLAANWLSEANFPRNVQIFPAASVEQFTHVRGERVLATVLGRSYSSQPLIRPADFRHEKGHEFVLAATCGEAELDSLLRENIDYWALGGQRAAQSHGQGRGMAHYPGAVQGLTPQDVGPHSCTLVSVDAAGDVRLRVLETDAVRWLDERVKVREGATRDEIRAALQSVAKQRVTEAAGQPRLIRWAVTGLKRQQGAPRLAGLPEELLAWLRGEFGYGKTLAWSLSLDLEMPDVLPADWYEEDSLLGDFLRTLKNYQDEETRPLPLDGYLPERQAVSDIAHLLESSEPDARFRLLRETQRLGVELLRGEETRGRDAMPAPGRLTKERVST